MPSKPLILPRMITKLFVYTYLYFRALSSARKAKGLSDGGLLFNRFGRHLGWKLIMQLRRNGLAYLINPVSSFRYFEFPFALSSLPQKLGHCLDVSSPMLFSFYVSQNYHPTSIWMINPDVEDIQHSAEVAKTLNFSNIQTECHGVEVLENTSKSFNSIWAISVVEHISGNYDDSYAVRLMYRSLAAGGRLILTVPVDRKFWVEYRDQAYYGVPGEQTEGGQYFFQRHYDKNAICMRLVNAIGVEPSTIRWFGEKRPGHFSDYEKRWIRDGYKCTYNDPLEMSENYQEYPSWEDMPGMGVCGLVFIMPLKQ